MQRHKAGSRVTPGGSSNPAPSPAWQQMNSGYGGIKLCTPNENPQSNADIGRVGYHLQGGLSNVPQPDLTSQMDAPLQAQHWDWTNGTTQSSMSPNVWDWGHAAQTPPQQQLTSRNGPQQYSQQSQQTLMTNYEHSPHLMAQLQQQHTNWNANQHQAQAGPVQRSFSDVWNWGGESDSPGNNDNTSPVMSQQAHMDMSQQFRQVPDGQDQGGSQYTNWNQNKQVQYDWTQVPHQQLPQGHQNSSVVQPTPSWDYLTPTTTNPSVNSNNLPDIDLTLHTQSDDLRPRQDVPPNMNVPSDVFQPDVQAFVTGTHLNSAHENLLPDLTAHCADEENAACPKFIENSNDGTVATFFQCGQEVEDDNDAAEVDAKLRNSLTDTPPSSKAKVNEDLAKKEIKQDAPHEQESLGPNAVWGRAPYLRQDSWFSNSSLMTYNRSTTGSQELLSGSFLGEDGHASIGSVSGLCQSVDDMHLYSTQSLPYQLHHHPLHQSHPTQQTLGSQGLQRRRSSVEEQVLSLPLPLLTSDQKMDVIPALNEARRASLPLAVLPNQEVVTESLSSPASSKDANDNADALHGHSDNFDLISTDVKLSDQIKGVQEAGFNEEVATNLEVPPNSTDVSPMAVMIGNEQSSVALIENVEVVPPKSSSDPQPSNATTGNYKLPGWSREGSAFQPPPVRLTNVTPVIQREAPDQQLGEVNANHAGLPSEILKTEPESANLETVPDNVERPLDTDGVESVKKSSPSRSPLHSSFARQHLRDVHSSSPATSLWENPELAQDFGVKLSPAVLSANSQPSQQQGVLVVPQLDNLLDNPLGVSKPNSEARQPSVENASSKGVVSDRSELLMPRIPSTSKESREVVAPSGASPAVVAPMDLSSRAAPQGRSAADEDNVRNVQPRQSAVAHAMQGPPIPPVQSIRPEEGDRRHYIADHPSNELERDSNPLQRISSGDDGGRAWSDRRRYSIDRDDEYDQQNRRRDYLPPDPRDDRGRPWGIRDRDYDRDRERPPINDPYYQSRYDVMPERERSRPSSRSSTQDFDTSRRDRHYDRGGRYLAHDDPRRLLDPPRPSSRSGYESDQGSGRYGRPGYEAWDDYYQRDPRDPRYSAYQTDYYRQPRERYDQRYSQQPQQPYYGINQYNYGYYAELYGGDPRYRAYYDTMAKNYYWQYGNQYGYDDFDRRSVHSGRSSVTDDSQKGSERFSASFHQDNRPLESNRAVNELSTIYPQDGSDYPQGEALSNDYSEHHPPGPESISASLPQRLTPAKFSTPHLRATFSPGGQLVILPPNSIMDGQTALVEICDLQAVLASDPVAQELTAFPSPLIRGETHKNDVIQYCQQKARKAKEDASLPDRNSCILIWELLMLLIRQNGVVVGTDIAELLLKDQNQSVDRENTPSRTRLTEKSEAGSEVDEGMVVLENSISVNCQTATGQANNKFIEFLLFGHKKDALEWAMKQGLWGHALFLASKMESRTYAMVMTRFANSLAFNDPLQTLYQLMSGRQPAAVTGIADEKWGDWRPHLAIILSNSTQRPELDRRSVVTLGDTLAAHGCLHAAHFCYLMAQMDFGSYDKKSSKLVLIGSNLNLPFSEFATTEAIKCTEVYEYVQSLANPHFVLSHLQFYKFIYATRLVEFGYPQEALHYCEVITQVIQKMPALYSYELVHQVYQLAYRLKYYDPYYTQEEGEVADLGDPLWLRQLQLILQAYEHGSVLPVADYSGQPTVDSAPSNVQSYIDPASQSIDNFGALQTDVSYQQQTSYTGQDQVSHSYTQSSQMDYSDGTQQTVGYSEYQNQSLGALDENSIGQQQPCDNYYNQNGFSVAGEYGQHVMQSQYNDYYGMSASPDNTPEEYKGDIQDGQPRASQNIHNDYYGNNTRKNSVSSSPSSATAPTLKTAPPGEHSLARKNSGQSHPEKPKPKKGNEKAKPKQGGSWLGGIFSKFSLKPQNQMILPDDKNPSLVWDANDEKWINKDGDEEDETVGPIAPPKDLDLSPSPRPATLGAPSPAKGNLPPMATAPPSENRFKLRQSRVGMRQNYVDVLGGDTIPVASNTMPTELFPNQGAQQTAPQFFIPAPVTGSDAAFTDFVTTGPQANHIGNPGSRGGSPQQNFDEDDSSQSESNQGQQQPLMFNPSQIGRGGPQGGATNAQTGPRGGLNRYGRYPR